MRPIGGQATPAGSTTGPTATAIAARRTAVQGATGGQETLTRVSTSTPVAQPVQAAAVTPKASTIATRPHQTSTDSHRAAWFGIVVNTSIPSKFCDKRTATPRAESLFSIGVPCGSFEDLNLDRIGLDHR